MTALSVFYSQVSAEVKRGTALDSLIPGKVAQAVAWMEREHTFLYTERFVTLLIDSTVAQPRAIAQPTGFKKMYFWRIINSDGSYSRITRVDPTDQSMVESKQPQAYWQDGTDYFWLDNTPDQNYNTEMSYNQNTVLSSNVNDPQPYILLNYPDVIINQTMMYMAPNMRDDKVMALYKPLRDEAMKSAIDADVEARQSARSESMQYGWEYKEDINHLNTSGT